MQSHRQTLTNDTRKTRNQFSIVIVVNVVYIQLRLWFDKLHETIFLYFNRCDTPLLSPTCFLYVLSSFYA